MSRVRLFRGDGLGGFSVPVELRQRAGPLDLIQIALGSTRPSLLAIDRSAQTVVALGPIRNDPGATFPYAQTFGATPLQIAAGPITNRTTADVAVAEAATGRIVTQRGRRTAVTETYGTGCTGASGIPRMRWVSQPVLGSATFAVTVDAAAVNSSAVFLLGGTPLDLTLPGGCKLLVDQQVILGTATDASGAAAMPLAVPAFTGFLGANLYGQWVVVSVGGGLFGAFSLTPGIHILIGG